MGPRSAARLAAFVLAVTASAAGADEAHHAHVSAQNGVEIVHAWTRAGEGGTRLVFAEIRNLTGREIVLEGAESGIAEAGGLVGLSVQGGTLEHVAIPSVPIAPGRTLDLAPDGLAIRLSNVTTPLREGDEFEADIHFDVGTIAVHVAVEAANARRHSHAGHQH
ncbi:copper chaperone PCu(A)C [Acuticoccus sp. M5D2P5]|uniref:copper chaperone PCu(A)C n=1 Tax=Acuticoccus kalidii TaxID=2910977 RepID=UPI001F1AD4D9|nr:copper chaperone PCu(A)C [Acuticoccus kalidii]MCF3935499.1 copper chaperone PCu(A)C [Acuticoccus kalidii]